MADDRRWYGGSTEKQESDKKNIISVLFGVLFLSSVPSSTLVSTFARLSEVIKKPIERVQHTLRDVPRAKKKKEYGQPFLVIVILVSSERVAFGTISALDIHLATATEQETVMC